MSSFKLFDFLGHLQSEYNDFFKDIPFYKDTLMYYDGSHLNEFGAQKYAEYSGQKLVEEINLVIKK